MAVEHFPDGIKIGPDSTGNERLPLYDFDEWVTDGTDLGSFSDGEVKTIVFSNIPTVRGGAAVIASPMNPAFHAALSVKYAWVSNTNEISVMLKNDSGAAYTDTMADQWSLMYFNTSTP